MRVAVVVALILLSACVSDQLALAPPAGVNLAGHWRLNVADSDDPLHLSQSPSVDPSKVTAGTQSPQGGGQGGGRGGRGARGGAGFGGPGMPQGPMTPALSALSEALRWPGNEVEIKQIAGVVTLTSAGVTEVYEPTAGEHKHPHHKPADDDESGGRDRDMPARGGGRPPMCGWDDKTLVVQSSEPDEDRPPFEKRYSISDDGQRLVEIVSFQGGRSAGFTTSREWDRVDPNAPPVPAAPVLPPRVPAGINPNP